MCDLDIRGQLRIFLKNKFSFHDPECIVRDEFGLCQGTARIDIAVINGRLHGYEIKSEEDTLKRLSGQLAVYTKIFDYLTFVTNDKHLEELERRVPAWCGLMVASYTRKRSVKLMMARVPKINRNIDPHSLVQLLWRDETIQILREIGLNRGLESKSRKVLWDTLAANVSLADSAEFSLGRLTA